MNIVIAFLLSPILLAPQFLLSGFTVWCLWGWYVPLPPLTFAQSVGLFFVAAALTGRSRYDSDTNENEINHYGRILIRTALILFCGWVGHFAL